MSKITNNKMDVKELNIKISNFIEKYYKIIFSIILLLAVFLNIFKMGEIPNGIDTDEAGMGYDSYCIANFGVDRYLNKFPIYFINFGDGQSALYTYLAAIFVKIFGLSNLVIRIPALILSIIEIIVAYFIAKEYKGKKTALLFMLLITISPWHIMKSRWALDANLFSPLFLISIYFLLKAIKSEKINKYIISGIFFGITLYTYALSYIIIPIFLLLTLIYLIKLKKIKFKNIIGFSIPLIILAVPLILLIMVQKGYIQEINSFITIPKLSNYRASEINIKNIRENIGTLKYVLLEDKWDYDSIHGFGTLYSIGTILMVLGLCIIIINDIVKKWKSRDFNLNIIMLFAFVANLILAFAMKVYTYRLNGIFISAIYFIAVAIKWIYKNAKLLFCITIILYYIYFISFTVVYFNKYKNEYHYLFDYGFIDTIKYAQKNNSNEKEIYTLVFQEQRWIFELYATQISPYEAYPTYRSYNKSNSVKAYKNFNNVIDIDDIKEDAIYIIEKDDTIEELEKRGLGNYYSNYYFNKMKLIKEELIKEKFNQEVYNNYYIYEKK